MPINKIKEYPMLIFQKFHVYGFPLNDLPILGVAGKSGQQV